MNELCYSSQDGNTIQTRKTNIMSNFKTFTVNILREASHIDFVHEKRHMFVWGWGVGGGGLAAVTFLCKTSWKKSIVFSKALTFRNHHCKIQKTNNLMQRPVYTFVLYLVYVELVLYLV